MWHRCSAAYRHRVPPRVPRGTGAATLPRAMAKVCHSCGKGPAFGNSRSHSMVATKRRFDPNLQKVRVLVGAAPQARLRLHALPQGRQGHQGRLSRAPHARCPSDPSLVRFRAVVEGALAHLESRRQEINDLNVFPVADGDTGDNMALTLRAVLDELDRLASSDRGRRRDRPRRDRRLRGPRRAARRARQQRRHPLPAHPRRGRGARLPPRRAGRPGARRRRDGPGRPARLRLGPRAGRGHDAHGHARDGGVRRHRASRTCPPTARGSARTDPAAPERADRRRPRAGDRGGRGVRAPRPRAAAGARARPASSTPAATR